MKHIITLLLLTFTLFANIPSNTYDPVGNLKTKTLNGISESYTYNANDQLTQKGSITYTYDANGNLIDDGTNSYEYDDKNRLVKVITPTNTIEYSYDAQDHRIAKIVEGTTTTYLVDPNTPYARVIHESRDNGTEIDYSYGLRLLSDGSHSFLTDALGSTRALADGSGQITDSYDYSPYGTLLHHVGSSDNDFLFTGEQYDPEAGLYYLRARYYSPELTRFLSRDTYEGTLTDPLSQNPYLYARGNPTVYVDPSGRFFIGISEITMVMDLASFRVTHISKSTKAYVPYIGRAAEIALNSGHSVRALRAMRRGNPGLFKRLSQAKGANLQIHHVLEKRFFESREVQKMLQKLGKDIDDVPGMTLTAERHQIITNRWKEVFPRKNMTNHPNYKKVQDITIEDLINAIDKIYYDDPLQKQSLLRFLGQGLLL